MLQPAEMMTIDGAPRQITVQEEYWVVDVVGRCVETFRGPVAAAYAVSRAVTGDAPIAFEAFPDVVFTVDELLG